MSGRENVHKGRVVFGAMDEVVFGHPAAQAIIAQIRRLGTSRAFLMVSGTLKAAPEHFDDIARQAMATPWVPRNPRRVDGPAEVIEILQLAA
jgi:maleylacetate reductase